ncbi:uncharacterized protein [Dysidea avara]|uniref:uncharacterized protein isoform X2 n=1 Tax=Dysidea avara TaxID=196820 RepID=UPI0033298001
MEGKYAANRKEALAFKKELELIKKKANVNRRVLQLGNEDGSLPGDDDKLAQRTTLVPKPPREPKPRKPVVKRQSPWPSSQLKLTPQHSGVELRKRSFSKKEGSPKKFAIAGACSTTVSVPLLKRPIPPAKQPLNLPVASPRNPQEDEERSSKITSLPQQLKSRPTTRTSMQTSEGMSKSSFQQYILATADYMHTTSEPFSMVSGSPLDSRAQSQTPGKRMPLRVHSLPDFSMYASREALEDGDEPVSGHYSRQQDDNSLNSAGTQSAMELVSKRQSRALKLEVDLRDATRLVITDTHSEATSTQQIMQEQTTTPTEQSELPTVNVIESQTPHPNTTNMYDHNVTVTDGIYWDQQSVTDNLAVSDAVTESSSTVTLKDEVLSHSLHHHGPSYSDSLCGGQSTAERSLTYDQGSSQVCSEQDLGDVQEDDYLGSGILSSMAAGELDASMRAQTDMDINAAFDVNINAVMVTLPDHLDNTSPMSHHITTSVMTDNYPSSKLTTYMGSGITPSQRSHIGLIPYQDPSFTHVLKETSVSAPAMVALGAQHSIYPENVEESHSISNLPQAEVISAILKPTTREELSPKNILHHDDDLLTPALADCVFHHDSENIPATAGLSLKEKDSSLQQTESKDLSSLVNDNTKDTSCDHDVEQEESQEPFSFQQPSDSSSTDKDAYFQFNTLSGVNLNTDTDPSLADHTMEIEPKHTADISDNQNVVTKPASSWSDQIMAKLLNNQADDVPVQSLAEFLAYTNKPVTLEDIMSIKGESLTPGIQPHEDAPHDNGGELGDNKASTGRQTSATPRLLKSAGKKKVMFLSEWPQSKTDLETNLTFKRLAEPSSRNSIHHFCIVPESPQLPYQLQVLSCKLHSEPHPSTETDIPELTKPPTTPEIEGSVRQPKQMKTLVKEDTRKHDPADMIVEGRALHIISDSSSLLWKLAPAKLSLFPSTIKSHLFPQYHGLSRPQSSSQAKIVVKLPVENDAASHSRKQSARIGSSSLEFRSLVDFSKYSAKELPKLVPFPDPANIKQQSSIPSCSSSYTSLFTTDTATASESQRAATQPTADSDDDVANIANADNKGESSSSSSDDDEMHEMQSYRMRQPRRSTITTVQLSELRKVSSAMRQEMSKLQQCNENEETSDIASSSTTSVITDTVQVKRHCVSMPNITYVGGKPVDVKLDFDDFTNTMSEVEKQQGQLASYHGLSKTEDQAIDSDECLSGTTDLDSVFLRDEQQFQQRGRRFRPAHTRPGRGGRQKTVRKRTKSALARAYKAKKLISQPARQLKRCASFPLLAGTTSSIEITPPSSDYRKSRRLSDPVYYDFDSLVRSYNKSFTTEKECYKWVDQLWDVWFEEAYAECKAALEMPLHSSSSFTPSNSKLQITKEKSKEEGSPKIYELQNIDKTIFDDEASESNTSEKVDEVSLDIQKATTVETKAIYLCRRGALLRKLGKLVDARDDLEKAIALVPRLVDAYWHRHCLFLIQNDSSSAMADLDTILTLNRRHTKAYRSKAILLANTGDLKEALFCLSQTVVLDRKNKSLYKQRAAMYEQKGSIESAIEDYQTMVDIDPSDSGAILKMGIHYYNKSMWSAASQSFSKLVQQDASNTTARVYRAQTQWKLGNYVQALQDLSAAVHLDPNNAAAYYHRACLIRIRHPHKALQDYSTSLLLDNSVNNVMAYLHRGILYTSMKCYTDAIPDFEAAIKLDNTVACFHVCLGLTYLLYSKQYQRAINCFTTSIKTDPTYVRAYVCRAEAYQQLNKLKNALLDYARASHIQPDEPSYLLYKGYMLLLMNKLDLAHAHISTASKMGALVGQETAHKASLDSFLGNHEEAIKELVVAVRSKPSPEMFSLLGRTCQNAGDHVQAVSAFDRAIEATDIHSHASAPPKPELLSQIHFLCGTSHTELGNYHSAIEHLNEALHHVPTNASAFYQRGIAKLKHGNNKGILDLNRALAINPKMFEVFLTRACYYSSNGRFTKAILNCNQAIQLQPQSVRAYLYRGSMKYYTKQYKSAIDDLTTAVTLDRQCSLAYFNRALCQQVLRNTDKAISDYSIVLLLRDEPSYEVLVNRGLLYLEMEEYGSALMDLISAGKLFPKNASIFQAIGLCYHRLEELQLSVEAYDQAVSLDNFFIEAYVGRGNVHMDYLTPGRLILSKQDYCKALHFDPCCLPARVNLAHTLQMEEKYKKSWNHFTCALATNPNYVPALEGRAVVSLQMGNLFGSLLDITAAIKISPSAELYTNRGVIHQFMGKGVDAMRDYEMALKYNRKYGLAFFNIGNVLFHHRQFQQSVDAYNKAVEASPSDDSYLLNRAIAKSLLKDYDGALEDFSASIEINPNTAHAYFNRANLYKSYQQYSLAEEDYKTALTLNPDDGVLLQYCAEVLGKQGKAEEAIKYFEAQLDSQ